MSDQYNVQPEQVADEKRASIKRRGLIAGAAALVAGVLAKQAAEPVAAGTDGDVVLGGSSFTNTTTYLVLNPPGSSSGPALRVNNGYTGSIDAKGDGIQGFTNSPNPSVSLSGVFGRVNDLNGVGTWGEAPNGTGAFGDSSSGSGVAGNSSSGAGVFGQSTSGTGVVGLTSTGLYGVAGTAGTASGSAGLLGYSGNPAGVAFGSVVAGGATTAGFFNGDVYVTGRLVVHGVDSKSALLDHPDGSNRLVYCVEASESWIEDFGTGTTAGGTANISLDKDFAALIQTDSYHVFITQHDDHQLHVSKRTATGFTVNADTTLASLKGKAASTLNGTFSYRVVARPKNNKAPERLATFKVPHLAMPDTNTFKNPTAPQPRPKK